MEFDFLNNLATGFTAAATFKNLGFALLGCLLGTLIGVLPGIGPIPTIAMLLPITFRLDPLVVARHAGGHLLRRAVRRLDHVDPGEHARRGVVDRHLHRRPSDGAAGARRGGARRRGARLVLRRDCVGTMFIAAFGPPLSALAQQFNSPDYFSLMVLGLVTAVVLAHGSVIKAIGMVMVGLLFGLVGTDVNSGVTRYTFGVSDLWDGIDFLPLVIGMFGVVEIIRNLEQRDAAAHPGAARRFAICGRA